MARAAKYIALLGLWLAVVAVGTGLAMAQRYGDGAMLASALAAALIWALGSVSLLLVALPQTGMGRLNGALAGMLVRMSLPLAALVYFDRRGGLLAASGIATFIVIYYLVGLVAEIYFCVRLVAAAEQRAASSAVVDNHSQRLAQ